MEQTFACASSGNRAAAQAQEEQHALVRAGRFAQANQRCGAPC
jgi:hypothetical protein